MNVNHEEFKIFVNSTPESSDLDPLFRFYRTMDYILKEETPSELRVFQKL